MGLLFFLLLDFKLCHHFIVPDVVVGLVPNLEYLQDVVVEVTTTIWVMYVSMSTKVDLKGTELTLWSCHVETTAFVPLCFRISSSASFCVLDVVWVGTEFGIFIR